MEGVVSIFDGCGTEEQFRYCTLLEVSANDGFPSKLCKLCIEHMKIAYDFRFQATYAENFLSTVLKKEFHAEAEQENAIVENIEDLNENMLDIGKLLSHRVSDVFEPVVIEKTINKDNRSTLSGEEEHNSLQSDDHFSNAFACSNDNQIVDIFEEKFASAVTHKNRKLVCNNNSLTTSPEIRTNADLENNYGDSTAIYLGSCTETFVDLSPNGMKVSETKLRYSPLNNLRTLEPFDENVTSDNVTPSTAVIASENPPKRKHKNPKIFPRSKRKDSYRKENREKIECNICGTTFTHINSLRQHLMKHSGEKPFKCEFCEKCFARKTILTIHRRLHTGDRPYRCDECIRTFVTKEALNRHKDRDHNEDVEANFLKNKVTFICSICHKARCSKYSLAAHMRTHSAKREELDSSEISNDATEKIELQISNAKMAKSQPNNLLDNVENKPFSTFKYCKICQQGFASKWELVTHQEIHRMSQIFECDVCQRTFDKKYMLLCHLQVHDDAEMLTKKCLLKPVLAHIKKSMTAAHEIDLRPESDDNDNIEVDEDDIPLVQRRRKHIKVYPKNFSNSKKDSIKNCELKCQLCKQTFSHPTSMHVHIMKHLRDRPFNCEHCSKCFGRKNLLDMHRRLHISNRIYQCPLCEMACTTKKTLLGHLSELHQETSEKNNSLNRVENPQNFIKHNTLSMLLCNLCNAEFFSTEEYTIHLNVHDGAEPTTFECEVCKKSFNQKLDLIFHLQKHQIEKEI